MFYGKRGPEIRGQIVDEMKLRHELDTGTIDFGAYTTTGRFISQCPLMRFLSTRPCLNSVRTMGQILIDDRTSTWIHLSFYYTWFKRREFISLSYFIFWAIYCYFYNYWKLFELEYYFQNVIRSCEIFRWLKVVYCDSVIVYTKRYIKKFSETSSVSQRTANL